MVSRVTGHLGTLLTKCTNVLDNQLARDSCTACAYCEPRGDLFSSCAPTRERQVGDIQPSNQHDQQCSAPKKVEGVFHVPNDHLLKRFHLSAESRVSQDLLELGKALRLAAFRASIWA